MSLESYPAATSVNRAFSKQSVNYDHDDQQNKVLQDMRLQVYRHVAAYMKPQSSILELNSGTGIDALHFAQQGHSVLATDISDGMIEQINLKIQRYQLQNRLACLQLSYSELDKLNGKKSDYVFSNFGGLNCIDNLAHVTKHLPTMLTPGGYITWVIMPPVCLWEMLSVFNGNGKRAFRRLNKNGVIAHLEGEYFKMYYFSLPQIKAAFGPSFKFIKSEGLCALSPPPSRGDFPSAHPTLYRALRKLDSTLNSRYPLNRWADHIIVTFQFTP